MTQTRLVSQAHYSSSSVLGVIKHHVAGWNAAMGTSRMPASAVADMHVMPLTAFLPAHMVMNNSDKPGHCNRPDPEASLRAGTTSTKCVAFGWVVPNSSKPCCNFLSCCAEQVHLAGLIWCSILHPTNCNVSLENLCSKTGPHMQCHWRAV